jgi:uncharacterized protein YkwD
MRHPTAAFLAVLILALGLTAPAGAAEDPTASMLAAVNAVRASNGLAALRLEPRLVRAAREHAARMVARDFFDHQEPGGPSLGERLVGVGYGFAFAAENLSAGTAAAASVVRSWMLSEGHRRNLLEPRAVEAGIAYLAAAGEGAASSYRHYWVLVEAAPARP